MKYITKTDTALGRLFEMTAERIERREDNADMVGMYHWRLHIKNRETGAVLNMLYSQGLAHVYDHMPFRAAMFDERELRNSLMAHRNDFKHPVWNRGDEISVDIAIAEDACNPKRAGGGHMLKPAKVYQGKGPVLPVCVLRNTGLGRYALHKPIAPCLAGVLENLLSDANMGVNYTERDFLEDLGYGEDSYRGRQVFAACQQTNADALRLLPRDMYVKYVLDSEQISETPEYDEDYEFYRREQERAAISKEPIYFVEER